MLRQPKSVTRTEKYEYVESVIKMLGMEEFAEAVVGEPGQGLNVEQRKLLTIGVELAAKPKLLLFLDEPTSGLDSQSSWTICALLRKLADHGMHEPSSTSTLYEEQRTDNILTYRPSSPLHHSSAQCHTLPAIR